MCAADAAESEEASVPVAAQDAETDDGQPSTEGNQPATGGEGPAISPLEADKHDHQHPGADQGGDDAPIDNNSNGTEGTTVDAAATGLKEADPAAGNEPGLGTDKTTAPKGPEADPAAGAETGTAAFEGLADAQHAERLEVAVVVQVLVQHSDFSMLAKAALRLEDAVLQLDRLV